MRIFQKKWLVIRQNWTKFTQRASKSRRKSGSVVLVMEYRSAGIHGSIKWNTTDFPESALAITIDRPELYYDFLQKTGRDFATITGKTIFWDITH